MEVTFDRLHALARRQRRRLGLLAVMLCLAGTVVVAHGALGEGHMGDGTLMCLAVMSATGASLLALTRANAALLRAPVLRLQPVLVPASIAPLPPTPRSRAGPAVLQVFLR